MGSSNLSARSGSVLADAARLLKREPPKIGGSVGGFVAVVVCLVAVIIIACSAAVYLYREERQQDEESARRRSSRYEQTRSMISTSEYPSTSQTPKPSWLARLSGNPGSNQNARSVPPRVKHGRGGEAGWVQASSGDNWDAQLSSERLSSPQKPGSPVPLFQKLEIPAPARASRTIESPSPTKSSPTSQPTGDSISSVRFDLRGLNYRDSFAPSPQPTLQTLRAPSPISSGTASPLPLRSTSPEPMLLSSSMTPPGQSSEAPSYFTPQAALTVRTFSGGTKFIEAL
ncbi:hypothetical protein BDN72DRAFT_849605 [Pluteus cervinus]|uniref:Uncharacterized protein n=1 Tax=Pluteus cervinus TaxID=181527 RepID=A0ACD3A9J1_9AGAR|nr:hypothetical protein BDN72DRAFT_849605 [Pluteus cervinus]